MQTEPHENHRWLSRLAGTWEIAGEAQMGPGQPPAKSRGKETVRMLGELWAVAEGEMQMDGFGAGYMRMTLGFDPRSGRFVGNWVGSMMANQWVYDGELDADRRVLTLDTTGPNHDNPGNLQRYRDIIEIVSENERVLRSEMQGEDGSWTEFMCARYSRIGSV